MSLIGDSCGSIGISTSITTGQGCDPLGNWMNRGFGKQSSSGLGNSRPPAPTCNIPHTSRGAKVMMPIPKDQSWAPKIADSLMGDSAYLQAPPASGGHAANGASGSVESTQDNIRYRNAGRTCHLVVDEEDEGSQQDVSDISEDEEELRGIKAKPTFRRGRKGKEKKKVGRPIAYRGDPNAPELTDQERRRIKRRIANRESARRVRHKRQEELEDMQIKMEQIQAHNSQLQQHAVHIREQKDLLSNQLEEMEQKFKKVAVENKQLAIEIQALRQSLQLKMSALEDELDKRANEAEGAVVVQNAFGNQNVQSYALGSLPQAQPRAFMMDGNKSCPSMPLDWFPSLNLDDFRPPDSEHNFFDDTRGGLGIKREMVNENLTTY